VDLQGSKEVMSVSLDRSVNQQFAGYLPGSWLWQIGYDEL
jgi:hypothetical protein